MKKHGLLKYSVRSTRDEVSKIIKPGITTEKIDDLCYEFINDNKAFRLHYFIEDFKARTSPNHIVCHGIPRNKTLVDGDILNVDVTAIKMVGI